MKIRNLFKKEEGDLFYPAFIVILFVSSMPLFFSLMVQVDSNERIDCYDNYNNKIDGVDCLETNGFDSYNQKNLCFLFSLISFIIINYLSYLKLRF